MAVVSKEQLLDAVKLTLGENTSDEALKLIEDITDTISSYEEKGQDDWKTRYEENDRLWRQRYRDRFYSGETVTDESDPPADTEENEQVILSYEQLFKEE